MARPRLYFLVQRASHALKRRADQALLKEAQITAVQLGVLFCVEAEPGLSAQTLASRLGLAKSAVTPLLVRLEQEGLVQRTPDAADGRAMELALTRAGAERLAVAKPVHRRLNAALHAGFSDAELEIVARFLSHAIRTESPK